ncbi:MAG: orotate phosphoribosyltransferase [Burkholderiales bacterium]|nr:orotate phosphoribosyltransferase [Burkholderiales bacterium]
MNSDFRQDFIQFALEAEVLCFGEFKTKAGRLSPYFFNSGLFNDGDSLQRLGQFYAKAIIGSGIAFDMLYGPAYKGIPLVCSTAVALAEMGRNVPFCFNRKEAKDHGEGGHTVGAPLAGRVLIVDDVISAGTSVRESVEIIRSAKALPCGVVISFDRMERGSGTSSALEEIQNNFSLQVISISSLQDLISFLAGRPELAQQLRSVGDYRQKYGTT